MSAGRRDAALDMSPDEFRKLGHRLVDQISDFLASLTNRPVTSVESADALRGVLNAGRGLPEQGTDADELLTTAASLMFEHSLFNGHPRFLGYITSSAAPIGALGDLLASSVNPNVGAWTLAPVATEIEAQTVRWIAELIGYPDNGGGLLVSGGNVANFVCFLAARTEKLGAGVRNDGVNRGSTQRVTIYTSAETHTWIQKAADLFGFGSDAIRWIPVDEHQRMSVEALRRQIGADRARGDKPFLVVGTAGSVSTGAVDPLRAIGEVCRESDLWFHIDGAYGALAAAVPQEASKYDLRALADADSIAVDPHKWLYAPLEAGCALVRRSEHLRNTFAHRPPYYHFEDEVLNYVDYGLQNSRGFRALKVWLALQQAGRSGYVRMISDDIALARRLHEAMLKDERFEALTQSLSITTFRYTPRDHRDRLHDAEAEAYLNRLNQDLLARIEHSGLAFLSNAVVNGRFALRACVVNFRTTAEDIDALPDLIATLGEQSDERIRASDSDRAPSVDRGSRQSY
jgi:glutamate/tyrosine decarboxylase-like PLP-dependent enzyme